jgi:hypothetical protein
MLPYFNFEYVGIWAADRYSYLSSLCVVALLVAPVLAGLRSARPLHRRLGLAGLAVLLAFAGYQLVAGRRHQGAFAGREELWTYEKNLPHPSLLAFESYGKTMLLKAERAGADPTLRRRLLEQAVAAAREGLTYYQSLKWRMVPGYANTPPVHVAALFEVIAGATELAGGPLEQQLELRRAAYSVSSGDPQRQALARTLLALAVREPRDLGAARESLALFADHARFARRDLLMRDQLRAGLRRYTELFPELAAETAAIERQFCGQ